MRIVHACLRYPPATGGAETYIHEIVERTRNIDAGRDVRVLTSRLRTHGPVSELDPNDLLDDPPYVQRLHYATTPGLSYPRLQALGYYLGHHQPDIVVGHGYWYQPADAAAAFARRRNLPFIFHPYYYRNANRRKVVWRLYEMVRGRHTFTAAAAVVVISPYERSLIEAAGLSVRRFELISPGIDVARFGVEAPNPFAARGLTGPVVLTVSRIAPGKGLDELVAALPALVRQHPALSLVMIGEDFGEAAKLKALAGRLGVGNKVQMWGKVSEQTLAAAYQHATVFVHPSHYEAFGIVLAEAMAAGLPVVARRVAAVPYVVPDGKAGLLFGNADELMEAVGKLLDDTPLRQKFGEDGRRYVAEHFTWERSIKKMTELYNELGRKR